MEKTKNGRLFSSALTQARFFIAQTALVQRLVRGMMANIAAKAMAAILQILSLSILLRHWGADQYGVWLMLSAVPIYLGLTDLGFGGAAATDMMLKITQSDRPGALKSFQSAWLLITGISSFLVVIYIIFVALAYLLLRAYALEHARIIWAGLLMLFYTWIAIQSSIVNGVYRATQHYALGTSMTGFLGMADGLAVVCAAFLGGDIFAGVLMMLLTRLVGHSLFYLRLKQLEPWFELGYLHADVASIRRLTQPALASFALAASSAASLQGTIVVLGFAISPAAAASYAAARTLCRMPLQVSDVISRATFPELTDAYASRRWRLYNGLTMANCATSVAATLPFAIFLSVYGVRVASLLTNKTVSFDPFLFVFLSIGVVVLSLWTTLGLSLQSINRHHLVSYPYIIVSIAMASSPVLFQHVRFGVAHVAFVNASLEFIGLGAAAVAYARSLQEKPAPVHMRLGRG